MGRVCVVNFVSIDGVIQSPLAADEDRDGGFDRGGWVPPYSDEVVNGFMHDATVDAAALLMGRRTHEIMASAWASADQSDDAVAAMNRMPKYVVTSHGLGARWPGSPQVTGDLAEAVTRLGTEVDGDVVVLGSGTLVRSLARLDLVDEYRLLLFPVVLGAGKRMFDGDAHPADFRLADVTVSPAGVTIHTLVRRSPTGSSAGGDPA